MSEEIIWTTKNGNSMPVSTMRGKHIWHAEQEMGRQAKMADANLNPTEAKRCRTWIEIFRAERLRRNGVSA